MVTLYYASLLKSNLITWPSQTFSWPYFSSEARFSMGNSRSISGVSDLVVNGDVRNVEIESDTEINIRRCKTSLHYRSNYL